ncbi:MAG: serine/threonine protein kinase [Deltaproteobacteria bacterium]|nr:serine/threonine protein kinase [Deltaproteobacteria bacterium]
MKSRRTTRVGRYHLTERIAFGGMAEIFRGFTFDAEGFQRDVAVKKLLPQYAEDAAFVTMLTDEYKLVSHLHHPNIAEVYELAQVDGAVLVAMEYVDGKDLRSSLRSARRQELTLDFYDAAYVVASALDGLHHAHEASEAGTPLGIVHRDFSPSNILIAYDGRVKLIDFGIAKARLMRVQTRTGVIKGKVKYMSPEQAFGRTLDRRSDVFSAGSVLYELCAGQAPFKARTEVDLIYTVRDAAPRPCRELRADLPQELARIIAAAMSRDRRDRYPTALAFRDDLLRYLHRECPQYRRTRLARFMKTLWAEEIEADLRALEDYVLDLPPEPAAEYGHNLIAEALGPEAAYSHFSPIPTRVGGTQPLEGEATLPSAAPLKEAPTVVVRGKKPGSETR